MERLGLVTGAVSGGGRRAYVAPILFLAAATVTIGLLRGELGSHTAAPAAAPTVHVHAARHVSHPRHVVYVVRAGDTLEAIAARTHVTLARLVVLNPKVSPTALFIGEKLNLR